MDLPKIAVVSGFYYSGSSAVLDLLREFRSVAPFPERGMTTEFRLLWDEVGTGRVLDHLAEAGTLAERLRSSIEIRRVERRLMTVGRSRSKLRARVRKRLRYRWRTTLLDQYGYAEFVPAYSEHVRRFCRELARERLPAPRDRLEQQTADFLAGIIAGYLSGRPDVRQNGTLLLDQAVPPHEGRIATWLRVLGDCRLIVVDRDPRDTFVETYSRGLLRPSLALAPGVPRARILEGFVERYRQRRSAFESAVYPPDRVLEIRFEELVVDYDRCREKIMRFLGLSSADHDRQFEYFDPEISRRNVGRYRTYEHAADLRVLEGELESWVRRDAGPV